MENWLYGTILCLAGTAFLIVGLVVQRQKRPVRRWLGTPVPPEKVTDAGAFNRARGRLWWIFSVPLYLSGAAEFCWPPAVLFILPLTCIVGIGLIVWLSYRLEKQYIQP